MISIWLCPDYNNELYLQNVINCLSDIHNSPRFFPHCTLASGIKSNKHELENIIDNSSGSMSHRVDISSSSQGLYILELSQGDKKVIKKIIKR